MDTKKQPHHKYVFDTTGRKLVGAFEEMYRAEDVEGFDSWQQDNMDSLGKRLSLAVLGRRIFNSVLDIGCGKGAFTSLLKTPSNRIVGLDVSATAVSRARQRFPAIEFRVIDANDTARLRRDVLGDGAICFDQIVMKEVLSYLSNWRDVVQVATTSAQTAFVSLYLPPNPIGFVKTFADLKACLSNSHQVVTEVLVNQEALFLLSEKRPENLA